MADRAPESLAPALPDPAVGRAGVAVSEPRRRGRYSLLTRRDKWTLAAMVGIPVFFDLALIWGPTLVSVLFSFTKWDGIGRHHRERLHRAQELRVTPDCLSVLLARPPAQPHLAGVPDVHRDAARHVPGGPAGPRDPRARASTRRVFYLPVVLSLAVIGIIWTLQYAPEQGFINNVLGRNRNDNLIDWLGNPSLNLWAALVATSWRHVGYIMVLYLAGLKSVDPALREAAKVDGANERQTFFRVVFPVMAPINVVIVVITVIEALRAFDIVYIINRGKNGLELLSTLITNNGISESNRVGFASAIAVVLLLISLVPIIAFLSRTMREARR